MNEDKDNQKLLKSKYSSGVNIIIRLDLLWKDTHRHSRDDLFYAWNNDLDCIWRELARDLTTDKEYQEWKKKIEEIDEQLRELGQFKDFKPEGFKEISSEDLKKRDKQYQLLNEKQLTLARLENVLGKGTTEEDEDEDDFD
ncbi:MAG: hypothetical protein ACOC56_00425 [Atribacterota bacterium]